MNVTNPLVRYSVSTERSYSLPMMLLMALLLIASLVSKSRADYPSLPLTIQLGPNAEDFNNSLEKSSGPNNVLSQRLSALNGFDLSGRDLRLSRLHLEGLELRSVNFNAADLSGSNMDETHFDNCSFRRTNLRRTHTYFIAPNCDLDEAEIAEATILLTAEQLASTSSYRRKKLLDCRLSGEYAGLSFAGFNLKGTTFASSLARSDFTDASIGNCTLGLSKEQLLSTLDYKARDLDGITLTEREIIQKDDGGLLRRKSDLKGIDFSGFRLGMFRACDLSNANFTNAFFSPPDPQGPMWPSTRNGFIESPITSEQFYSTWNYQRKLLPPGFEFANMNLSGWDFQGMDLRGVAFRGCDLTGTKFNDTRGGIYFSFSMTVEQVKSTWNYKNNQMNEPGIYLHRELAQQFSLEYSD